MFSVPPVFWSFDVLSRSPVRVSNVSTLSVILHQVELLFSFRLRLNPVLLGVYVAPSAVLGLGVDVGGLTGFSGLWLCARTMT